MVLDDLGGSKKCSVFLPCAAQGAGIFFQNSPASFLQTKNQPLLGALEILEIVGLTHRLQTKRT